MTQHFASKSPHWFRVQDYGYMKSLDAAGWYRVLRLRKYYSDYFNTIYQSLHEANSRIYSKEVFWEHYYKPKVLDYKGEPIIDFDEDGAEPFPPPVTTVEELRLASDTEAESVGHYIKTYTGEVGYKLLMVDPYCTDEELKAAFERWLTALRKDRKYELPIKRSGRPTTNITFTEADHFSRWRAKQILAVWDLRLWSEVFGRKVSHTNIGHWVFPDSTGPRPDAEKEGNAKETGRAANKALDEAMAVIDTLGYVAYLSTVGEDS